jgi:hypothetical protein
LRSRISLVLAFALLAAAPSIASVDANARASGNDRPAAVAIGERLFRSIWPVQVLQVIASRVGEDRVVGLHLSGVKFHAATDRAQFLAEVVDLVGTTFAADPRVQEVDVWTTVPIPVSKGVVVSGDLAVPTTQTVFTVSVLRRESSAALAARLKRGTNVFLLPAWAQEAFTKR